MGLDDVTAAGAVVTIGDTTYRLARLGVGAFGEIMGELKRRRWAEVREAAKAFADAAPDVRREYLEPLVERAKSNVDIQGDGMGDFQAFMESPDGACFMFWVLVRANHPAVSSIDKARALLDSMDVADIKQLASDILHTSGLAALQEAVKN